MRNCRSGRTLLAVIGLLCGCRAAEPAGPISLEKIGTVTGPAEDGGFPGFVVLSTPLRDGRRIAFVPDGNLVGPVFIVGTDGAVVDTLAMPGEGPGQVQRPNRALVGRGDTLFLFCRGRVHVYSPELTPVREFPIPVFSVWSVAQLGNGDLALASATFGELEPVQVVSAADGAYRWGVRVPAPPRGSIPTPELRLVAAAHDGSLWVGRMMGRLQFVHYAVNGVALDSIAPEREWFPPYERYQMPSRTDRPNASLSGLWTDPTGRLWVVARAPDPAWASAEGEDRPGEGGQTFFFPKRQDDVYDAVIDVIDPSTSSSLATFRTDALLGFVIGAGELAASHADGDGWVQMQLWRVAGDVPPKADR